MQLVVLHPATRPRDVPLEPVRLDPSDSEALVWVDLDRTEALRLAGLVPGIPAAVARDLLDSSSTPGIRARGDLLWVTLLGVAETAGGHELADLDVLTAPGLLVTVHSGHRPALQRLRDAANRRRRLAPPLSGTALGLLLTVTLDAYDDLIDETEEDIGRLQDSAATADRRVVSTELLRHRRRMMAARGELAGQRALFAELARSGNSARPDDSRWIADRLEAAIASAREAADYALAGSWSLRETSRVRVRQLGIVLLAAWITLVGLVVILSLSSIDGSDTAGPLLLTGGLLAVLSAVLLIAMARRRWL
jgi:Mg2+ and Co2+ transporter CorA